MLYVSTRGAMTPAPFSEVLLGGLAPDGGLVMPEQYPTIDSATLQAWRSLSYPQLAFEIIRLFATDIDESDLRELVDRSYT
ncbi:MAG: threonine synthase, partial [Quisquiliibacterium sp.]